VTGLSGKRAMFKAVGFFRLTPEKASHIGVANTDQTMPCNVPPAANCPQAEGSIRAAAGRRWSSPIAIIDGETMVHGGMRASLVSRK